MIDIKKMAAELMTEAYEKIALQDLYELLEEVAEERKELWENVIKWRLGQRESPFYAYFEAKTNQPPL